MFVISYHHAFIIHICIAKSNRKLYNFFPLSDVVKLKFSGTLCTITKFFLKKPEYFFIQAFSCYEILRISFIRISFYKSTSLLIHSRTRPYLIHLHLFRLYWKNYRYWLCYNYYLRFLVEHNLIALLLLFQVNSLIQDLLLSLKYFISMLSCYFLIIIMIFSLSFYL